MAVFFFGQRGSLRNCAADNRNSGVRSTDLYFISSQNSISTVGLLLGIGTICSVIMITIVLPSVLYILDKFVLCLSLKKRKK